VNVCVVLQVVLQTAQSVLSCVTLKLFSQWFPSSRSKFSRRHWLQQIEGGGAWDCATKTCKTCASGFRPSLEKKPRPWNFYWTFKNISAVFGMLSKFFFSEKYCLHTIWNVAVTFLKFSWVLFTMCQFVSISCWGVILVTTRHDIKINNKKIPPLSVPSFFAGCNQKA